MKNIITFLVLFAISSSASYGQIIQSPVALPSPNAAGLGEYGDIPVSHYTGAANIEIPLCNLRSGSHCIPVSLTYNANGVRPDQHPGWVGLNWNLNAGGCITRTVNGLPDEYNHIHPKKDVQSKSGYLYNYSNLNFDKSNLKPFKEGIENLLSDYQNNRSDNHDYEPDRFTFNFLDYHGNFYIDEYGKWRVQCDKPLDVIFDMNDGFTSAYTQPSEFFPIEQTPIWDNIQTYGRSKAFKGFTILGEDGTKYIFGMRDEAIEFSLPFFSQMSWNPVATTWYLTKIEWIDGREAVFNYKRGNYIAQFYNDFIQLSYWGTGNACSVYNETPRESVDGTLIMPSYLVGITCGIDHLGISLSTTPQLGFNLRKICDPYCPPYPTDSKIAFPYLSYTGHKSNILSYPECLNTLIWETASHIYCDTSEGRHQYSMRYTKNNNLRMMLTDIYDETVSYNKCMYHFDYYNPELLPEYLSFQTDHWGFFNDHDPSRKDSYFDSREPNPDVMHYGSLKQITYPTGGFTRFVYEPHQYNYSVTENRTNYTTSDRLNYAGGIRIKRIVTSATGLERDTVTTKEYFYHPGYRNTATDVVSHGVLLRPIKYEVTSTVETIDKQMKFTINKSVAQSVLAFTPNTHGSHIGYSEVAEINADKSFSIYKFSNFETNPDIQPIFTIQHQPGYYLYTSTDQDRGLLKSKAEYDSDGKLVKKTDYEYEKFPSDNYSVPAFNHSQSALCRSGASVYREGTLYYNLIYSYLPKAVRDIEYDDAGNPFAVIRRLEHDSLGRVTSITVSGNQTMLNSTTLKYPSSFLSKIGQYRRMHESHIYSPVIERIEREYYAFQTLHFTSVRQFNHYFNKVFAPSSISMAYGDNDYKTVVSYTYDKYGNIVTEKPFDGPLRGYLWGFKGERLLAVAIGCKFNSNSYLDEVRPEKIDYAAIMANKTDKYPVTVFQYDEYGFVTGIFDTAQRKKYYSYDYSGRLVSISDYLNQNIATFYYNYQPNEN